MLLTTHLIAGAAAGALAESPLNSFLLGVISHHLLDALPHFDQGTFYVENSYPNYLKKQLPDFYHDFSKRDWIILVIDFTAAIGAGLFLIYNLPLIIWPTVAGGVLGGLLPDIINSSPLWSKKLVENFKIAEKYNNFHLFFHWTVAKKYMLAGILSQIVVIGLSAFLLTLKI